MFEMNGWSNRVMYLITNCMLINLSDTLDSTGEAAAEALEPVNVRILLVQ